ncbi:MAG: hypothetical protein R2783_06690 [Gelidibacter sp.]
MVTPRGLYALRVDDPIKVIAFNDKLKNGLNKKYEPIINDFYYSYYEKIFKKALIDCNGQCTVEEYLNKVEEYYIEWLQSWDTGLSLYKGTVNPDGSYTWEKQE